MKPFTALDEVLQSSALAPAPAREVAPAEKQDFQPLFSPAALAAGKREGGEVASHGEPQIEVVQEEGRVQKIIVTCSCGERTVLECAY